MEGSVRCSANYVPLSPLSFLERAAAVYGERVSVIHGHVRFTWKETRERCLRLASALARMGISRGDVVSNLSFISCFSRCKFSYFCGIDLC
ncbi:hypothetical protein IEQ34_018871 [Dendrobium chrysotoxum]|uniref:AMP-dependent synthetase/ligase domain-containing protein n=1 Tax=Dendrobium chrysotoxum TaxID=161865 RepID=A0AAV7G5R6_DENCH|nr:hypothetical protein IEQ34_018871 [Dendrobium chrysotoxum]